MQTPGFLGRNIRWLMPLLIIVAAVAVLILMMALRGAPPEKPPEKHSALVEISTVQMQPLQLTVKSQGLVTPKYTTNLVAQVSGEVVSLSEAFVRGGIAQKGEVLATIDPTNYEVAVENARASLASAEAALELEQAQGEVARVEWEDINDRPAPALGLRKPQLEQAKAQVTAARAALKQAQKDLDRTRIVAPYTALVAERGVSLGTFVNVGAQLGQVLDVSTAEIRLPIASSELQYLPGDGVGTPVILHSDKNGEPQTWEASIVRTEGVIDADTRMRYLVAKVTDPYHLASGDTDAADLAFGSYVVAQLQGVELDSAVQVPRYLVKEGKVALYKDAKLAFTEVEVIRNNGGESVIVGGVQSGDQLITTSLEFPVEGMDLQLRGEVLDRAEAQPEADEQPGAGEE